MPEPQWKREGIQRKSASTPKNARRRRKQLKQLRHQLKSKQVSPKATKGKG